MKKTLFVLFLIFFVVFENVSGISIYPQQIDFEVYEGDFSCSNVTIVSFGNVLLNDKWAKKNLDTKEMRLHKFSKESLRLHLDYPKEVFVSNREKIEVCFSGNSPGFYHGVFLAREESSNGGVRIWIRGRVLPKNKSAGRFPLTGMFALENSSNPSFLLSVSGVLLAILAVLLLFLSRKR